jgi:hypothetical protein
MINKRYQGMLFFIANIPLFHIRTKYMPKTLDKKPSNSTVYTTDAF